MLPWEVLSTKHCRHLEGMVLLFIFQIDELLTTQWICCNTSKNPIYSPPASGGHWAAMGLPPIRFKSAGEISKALSVNVISIVKCFQIISRFINTAQTDIRLTHKHINHPTLYRHPHLGALHTANYERKFRWISHFAVRLVSRTRGARSQVQQAYAGSFGQRNRRYLQ